MELHHDPRVDELSEFCKELKTSTFAYRKIGDGLLLVGTRTAKRSLSSKLLGDALPGWSSKLHVVKPGLQSIMDEESADNEIRIGALNDPNTEYRLIPGMAPIYFWPLDVATIEDILFHEVEVSLSIQSDPPRSQVKASWVRGNVYPGAAWVQGREENR